MSNRKTLEFVHTGRFSP